MKPQKGIHYFISGAAAKLRRGNIRESPLTAAGFDQDRSFMLIEIAGNDLHFQTISRTGNTVDSGVISKTRATFRRSSTKRCVSASRVSLSGARRIEDGWTVANTGGLRKRNITYAKPSRKPESSGKGSEWTPRDSWRPPWAAYRRPTVSGQTGSCYRSYSVCVPLFDPTVGRLRVRRRFARRSVRAPFAPDSPLREKRTGPTECPY